MLQGFGRGVTRVKAGRSDLVLKRIRPTVPADKTAFSLRFHEQFWKAGIPCPRLHHTLRGELFATALGDAFTVQDWCPGEHFDVEQADAETRRHHRRAVGALLGRAHAWGARHPDLQPPASARLSAQRLFSDIPRIEQLLRWNRGGRLMSRLWISIHESREFGRQLRKAVSMMQTAREMLLRSGLGADPRLAIELPAHGDIHFQNVLFESGAVSAVIDFDNAAMVPQAYDLGSTMAVVCGEREHEDDFLEAYSAGAGNAVVDQRLLRRCVLLRVVKSLAFQISRYTGRGGHSPDQARHFIRQLIRTLETELALT